MGLALSTSWNAFRHTDGRSILREIEPLGYNLLELSFNLTGEILAQIRRHLRLHPELRVQSVHNYTPCPEGFPRNKALPDCYSLSSLDPAERAQAVRFTKMSIDNAVECKAQAVVLHCGRVVLEDRTRTLIEWYEQGRKHCNGFLELRDEMIKERAAAAGPFFENTLRSLEELEAYAAAQRIKLGIENRFYYREIPQLEELRAICAAFKSPWLGYWHDTGHAQVMENLGFCRHRDYLESLGAHLVGTHLHDVCGCRDHCAPGTGELDFSILKEFLKEDTVRVIEAHHPATAEELIAARPYLQRCL